MTNSETAFNDEELIARLRKFPNGRYEHYDAADRIEQLVATNEALVDVRDTLRRLLAKQTARAERLAATNERLEAALREIDAIDPECERIGACSENAIRGMVLLMGEIARAALEGKMP